MSKVLSKKDFGPHGFRWLTLKRITVSLETFAFPEESKGSLIHLYATVSRLVMPGLAPLTRLGY